MPTKFRGHLGFELCRPQDVHGHLGDIMVASGNVGGLWETSWRHLGDILTCPADRGDIWGGSRRNPGERCMISGHLKNSLKHSESILVTISKHLC